MFASTELLRSQTVVLTAEQTTRLELPAGSPVVHEDRSGETPIPLHGVTVEFAAPATDHYTIEAKSHHFDVALVVREANGELLATDDDGWFNTHSRIVVRLTASQRYAVVVATQDGSGPYEITVRRGVPPESDEERMRLLAVDDLREELAARRAAHAPTARIVATLRSLGITLHENGASDEAIPVLREALELQQGLNGDSGDRDEALIRRDLGVCLYSTGSDDGLEMLESALGVLTRVANGADDADLADTMVYLAHCASQHSSPRAVELAEAGLAMHVRLHDEQAHDGLVEAHMVLGLALEANGRTTDALAQFEAALSMQERMYGGEDDQMLAELLVSAGSCHEEAGRYDDALAMFDRALAIRRRLANGRDDIDVVHSLQFKASGFSSMGRPTLAVPVEEEALAMCRRLGTSTSKSTLCNCLSNLALTHGELGRWDLSLPLLEEALENIQRLDAGYRELSESACLDSLGQALSSLGRLEEALQRTKEGLELRQGRGVEHPDLIFSLVNVANCETDLGQHEAALQHATQAHEMSKRLFGDGDHPLTALALRRCANVLESLGRVHEARDGYERSLAMCLRIHSGDSPEVALDLNNLAGLLIDEGRIREGLTYQEEALQTLERVYKRDHPQIVTFAHNLAVNLARIGQHEEAILRHREAHAMALRIGGEHSPVLASSILWYVHLMPPEEAVQQARHALEIWRRIHGDRDHPQVALTLEAVGHAEVALGNRREADEMFQRYFDMEMRLRGDRDDPAMIMVLLKKALSTRKGPGLDAATAAARRALAMSQRLYPTGDNEMCFRCHGALAAILGGDGQHDAEAISECETALAIVERLRSSVHHSAEARQALFDQLKEVPLYEILQILLGRAGRHADAFAAAERARSRTLLDGLAAVQSDPVQDAIIQAERNGDVDLVRALQDLVARQRDLERSREHLVLQVAALERVSLDRDERNLRRQELERQATELAARGRRLQDEETGLIGTSLPATTPTATALRTMLRPGELLIEFVLHDILSQVYVVSPDDGVEVFPLPAAKEIQVKLGPIATAFAIANRGPRGIDPDEPGKATPDSRHLHELFQTLMPPELWARVRTASRVFLVPHKKLYAVPFEALVTDIPGDTPVHWIESGPPISYVPAGSVLAWLRDRQGKRAVSTTRNLVIVGDPGIAARTGAWPEAGAFVTVVEAGANAANGGVLVGDIVLAAASRAIADDRALREFESSAAPSTTAERVELEVWRAGSKVRLEVVPGRLGIDVAPGGGRAAVLSKLGAVPGPMVRENDLACVGALAQLGGAAKEAATIASAWSEHGGNSTLLAGPRASEASVRDAAPPADCLHFACHGISAEHQSTSLSMLVLAAPENPLSSDDGLLRLGDLQRDWRGKLDRCQLVVLSACRTNVGSAQRDDAPQALPLGFLLAGSASVVSTLWAVDDASTKDLMVDFHRRMLEGQSDRLKALTDAKKELRRRFPSPYFWAPFLFSGLPD